MTETQTQNEAWTIQRLIGWTTDFFSRKGCDAPRLAAEILLAAALDCPRIELYTRYGEVPREDSLARFRDWVKRHGAGEPVAYLVGHQEFYSLRFHVNPDVLIPRPETEHVVMAALECAKFINEQNGNSEPALQVADIATGSGCIAITLAKHLPQAQFVASDVSKAALDVAASNIELHGTGDQVALLESDLFAEFPADAMFDLVVSNPPYIGRSETGGTLDENVARYQPDVALFGGEKGSELIERLVVESSSRIRPGGFLIFELSPFIADECVRLVEASPAFDECKLQKDYSNHPRLLQTRKTTP